MFTLFSNDGGQSDDPLTFGVPARPHFAAIGTEMRQSLVSAATRLVNFPIFRYPTADFKK